MSSSSLYTGLHIHSQEGSFLDGYASVEQIAKRAKDLNQQAVALTDHGECAGHFHFQKACQKHDVKPIFGMEGYLVDSVTRVREEKDRLNSHITLLAKNQEGLSNLWAWSSLAYEGDNFYYRPLADWAMAKKYSKGLYASDGCLLAFMARALIDDDSDRARQLIGQYLDVFGDNFYMELHTFQFLNPQTDEQKSLNAQMSKVNQGKVQLAHEYGIPLVVVNDAHYSEPEHWENHALVWEMNTTSNDDQTGRGQTAAWMMDEDELVFWMNNHGISRQVTEEAIRNTNEIAENCNAEIQNRPRMPRITQSEEDDLKLFLRHVESGFKRKVEEQGLDTNRYWERVEEEVRLITEKGFYGYFNVVADYTKYAKEEAKMLVGPSRGSAGGSLTAYLMDITEIDPLKYDLLFGRFIAPSRKGYPDVDLDFPQSKRPEMKEYLSHKYGHDHVCGIGTFSKLQPKGVIADLSRAMSIPFEDKQKISKIIEKTKDLEVANVEVTWTEVIEAQGGDLIPWLKQYPLLFEKAGEMVGMIRQPSTHAAGLLVSNEPLYGSLPTRVKNGTVSSQFEMFSVEELGYVKFDLLGIRHLDTLEKAAEMIKERHGVELDFYAFDDKEYSDPAIWPQIDHGQTLGIFQLEACIPGDVPIGGSGMTMSEFYRNPKDHIFSYDEEAGQLVWNEVVGVVDVGEKYILEIELEDGRVLKCTEEHRVFTQNRGWVQAGELTEEDELVTPPTRGKYPRTEAHLQKFREASLKVASEGRGGTLTRGRTMSPEQVETNRQSQNKYWADATKRLEASERMKEKWADPDYAVNQRVKLNETVKSEAYRESCRGRSPRGAGRSKMGHREDLGHFCRSTWEANVARVLRLKGVGYEFEPEKFILEVDGKKTSYTPDFKTGPDEYIEVKGYWAIGYREKFDAFQLKYPEKSVRLIGLEEYRELKESYHQLLPEWEEDGVRL